ncbi:hypothetical protein D3C78_1515610 [compost metagenome]
MQVAVGAEFRGQGADLVTAGLLRAPDAFPVLLVEGQFPCIFGSRRVRNLRALVVTDPGLDMVNPLDESAQVIGRVIQQALAGHDPMADVTGEQQLGQLPDQLQGHPGVEQRT